MDILESKWSFGLMIKVINLNSKIYWSHQSTCYDNSYKKRKRAETLDEPMNQGRFLRLNLFSILELHLRKNSSRMLDWFLDYKYLIKIKNQIKKCCQQHVRICVKLKIYNMNKKWINYNKRDILFFFFNKNLTKTITKSY